MIPRWKELGYKSQQHYAGARSAGKRRIGKINIRLEQLGWFEGVKTEEGKRLSDEKGRILNKIAPIPGPPSTWWDEEDDEEDE